MEYLRLRRSWRGPAVLVVFLLFGLIGPLTAEYLGEIVNRLGSDGIQVIVPEATLADGFAHFLGNVHQIGLIVVIAVTASALAFDADPEVATFLRTRVPSIPRLVLTRSAACIALCTGAFALGTVAAWYETVLLIGNPPVSAMLTGIILATAYYGSVVALVALAASLTRSPPQSPPSPSERRWSIKRSGVSFRPLNSGSPRVLPSPSST